MKTVLYFADGRLVAIIQSGEYLTPILFSTSGAGRNLERLRVSRIVGSYTGRMKINIHGTNWVSGREHPVLDIAAWEARCPLAEDDRDDGMCVNGPGDLARREQAVRLAQRHGDLGPSVPADVFVWTNGGLSDKPWLTRLGGTPWRPKNRPWPRDKYGVPLAFLGQICFADSMDILPFKLPGDVALIFGTYRCGYAFIHEGAALEWSPLKIDEPMAGFSDIPWTGALPFSYQGVIHRMLQYKDWQAAESAFQAAGYDEGGWGVHSTQATSIGAFASLPQGWPFEEGDGYALVATLSSFYFRGEWPLCNIPRCLQEVDRNGRPYEFGSSDEAHNFGIGDVGCIWIYRERTGKFGLDEACG